MSKESDYLQLLDLAGVMQFHIAELLRYKAMEAGKAKSWVCAHANMETPMKPSLAFHDQIVEVIDGITKIQQGLAAQLKLLSQSNQRDTGAGAGDFFGGMDRL